MNEEDKRLMPEVSVPEGVVAENPQSAEPVAEVPALTGPVPLESAEAAHRPQVTFMGNSYDLTAVVAVTAGAMVAIPCVTCNMGYYCLPVVPIVLGLVGLLSAKDSVDAERTRLLSWLGIGGGVLVFGLMILAILAYFGFIAFAIMAGAASQGQ